MCLVRPGRGGKSRNLTTLVKNQILNFDDYKGSSESAENRPEAKRRKKEQNEDELIAKRASAKLEEEM